MPYSITEIIRRWYRERDDEALGEPSPELVVWSNLFGTDLERAWAECARGDAAVVLAAACGAPLRTLALGALDAAEEAQRFVPKDIKLGRRLLDLSRRALKPAATVIESMNVLAPVEKQLCDRIARRRLEVTALGQAHEKLFGRACIELAQAMSAAIASPGMPPHGPHGTPEYLAWAIAVAQRCGEAEARFFATKLGSSFQASSRGVYLARAEVQALEAATAASTAAISSALEIVLLGAIDRAVAIGSDAMELYVEGTDRLNAARAAAVIAASRTFSRATESFRSAACASSESTKVAAAELGFVAFRTAVGHQLTENDGAAMRARAAKHADKAAAERQLEHAKALRAAIPFSSLRPPLDDEEKEELAQRATRETLRTEIARLAGPLRIWGDAPALDAFELVTAILEAPGNLDRRALAPAVGTMHERAGDLFAAHAAATEDEVVREGARAASESAREAARAIGEIAAGTEENLN